MLKKHWGLVPGVPGSSAGPDTVYWYMYYLYRKHTALLLAPSGDYLPIYERRNGTLRYLIMEFEVETFSK